MALTESHVEEAALDWFGELGYAIGHGLEMASDEAAAERETFGEEVLEGRLRESLRDLIPLVLEKARQAHSSHEQEIS